MRTRDFSFVVLAGVLWGGGGTVGTLLARHAAMNPLSVATWRLLLGGAVVIAALAITRRASLVGWSAAAWRRLLAMALFSAIYQGLYFTAVSFAGVGLSTLIALGSVPAWVFAWDALVRRERADAAHVAAFVVAVIGLGLVVGSSAEAGDRAIWGAVLALGVGASFAGITLINRTSVPGLDPVALTGSSFLVGGVVLIPLAATTGFTAPSDATGWGLALALGVGITALAYILYLAGLATVPPFVATIVVLLEPLVGTILGVVVLGERLGVTVIIGAALLALAVVMLRPQRDSRASRARSPRMVKAQAGKAEEQRGSD